MINDTFYPTPKELIDKMLAKVQGKPQSILEPSAGKGDIVKAIEDYVGYGWDHRGWTRNVMAIEKDPDLRATLRGKRIKVIDTDFLTFAGPDKFDLIIANPPFDEGDKHLLKAIDMMYCGEIVFLLNAGTIRNPYSNTRKLLEKKLAELNADIEFIENAFANAERKANVDVALVYIKIERNVEDDLFAGVNDVAGDIKIEPDPENYEVSTGKRIPELVAEYNQIVNIGIETIINYYRNFKKIGKYIGLKVGNDDHYYSSGTMTERMQEDTNYMVRTVREAFWRKTLDLPDVVSRLASSKQSEFEATIQARSDMDFTEANIRQFIINLINAYPKTLTEAVLDIFDMFTIRHCYGQLGVHEKNIHYFNGWKTNNAFKVGKRVVIPIYGYYGGPFTSWGEWRLDYEAAQTLRDIDIVMNYFDGMSHYLSMADAIRAAFERGQTRGICSTYFTVN